MRKFVAAVADLTMRDPGVTATKLPCYDASASASPKDLRMGLKTEIGCNIDSKMGTIDWGDGIRVSGNFLLVVQVPPTLHMQHSWVFLVGDDACCDVHGLNRSF